jgi:hypothetical protein
MLQMKDKGTKSYKKNKIKTKRVILPFFSPYMVFI